MSLAEDRKVILLTKLIDIKLHSSQSPKATYIGHLNHLNRLSRNKLIVTKHQSQPKQQQHQINNPQTLLVADDVNLYNVPQQKLHQSVDGGEGAPSDCLSDSTIEKMRLQVRMQREKVEDER